MAYTVTPSIGMLPIEDIDTTMQKQGFIKKLEVEHIKDITAQRDSLGNITVDGIDNPSRIALCVNASDRETVNNAKNLDGKAASEYLTKTNETAMKNIVKNTNNDLANEVQLLRSELYNLKAELVKNGNVNDTFVADGFIDGFKLNNKKYDENQTKITIAANAITQRSDIVKKDDWIAIEKDINSEENSCIVTKVTNKTGNKIEIECGISELNNDNTLLYKTLGEYNNATFSFSKITNNVADEKERYTMLNDDSKMSSIEIKDNYTGCASILKIPSKCKGFLTKFTVYGAKHGNPGLLKCYVIKGDASYINTLSTKKLLSTAEANGNLICTSSLMTYDTSDSVSKSEGEIIFNFIKADYDINGQYPELDEVEYCFVIEADNVSNLDYWEIYFGEKKPSGGDLQSNNLSFNFYNKDRGTFASNTLVSTNTDMLYCVTTKAKLDETEVPYSYGLYSTEKPIKMGTPITATRARLILEVNREGVYRISSKSGVATANTTDIKFSKLDNSSPSQITMMADDKIVIGDKIATVVNSSTTSVKINKNLYIEQGQPIYRCGYHAMLRLRKTTMNSNGSISESAETLYPLELVSVIPSGREDSSKISDRLVFETTANISNIVFNEADLQIMWKSPLTSSTIASQLKIGEDYVGRIYNLSLAFDNKQTIS